MKKKLMMILLKKKLKYLKVNNLIEQYLNK